MPTRLSARTLVVALAAAMLASILVVVPARPAGAIANWTTMFSMDDGMVLACKKYRPTSGFGPLWEVHVAALNGTTGHTISGELVVRRNGARVNRVATTAAPGQWTRSFTYASAIHADTVDGAAGASTPQGGFGEVFPRRPVTKLATCA